MVNQHTQLVGTKLCAGPAHTILRIDAMLYRYHIPVEEMFVGHKKK